MGCFMLFDFLIMTHVLYFKHRKEEEIIFGGVHLPP